MSLELLPIYPISASVNILGKHIVYHSTLEDLILRVESHFIIREVLSNSSLHKKI